jgi:hypothetical protein
MIKVIKISTGEEIVGEVDVDYKMKDPCILQMVPSRSDPTKGMMALIPYASHIKNSSIELSPEHIIWEGEPVEELYNQYNSIYGSGIQLASSILR